MKAVRERERNLAFTMLEVLCAAAVFLVILLVILGITQQTGSAWQKARARAGVFQEARRAFDVLTDNLGQATLNTYYDYFDSAGRSPGQTGYTVPDHYGRQSDLHFISGKSLVADQVTHSLFFQVPAGRSADPLLAGMDTLLNACGFYVMHGLDPSRPAFLATVPNSPPDVLRYRLIQFLQPSQDFSVYRSSSPTSWFQGPLSATSKPISQLAANTLALVVLPRLSEGDASAAANELAPDYEYDSRKASLSGSQLPTENQLPPLVEIVMVVVDENSADRIERTRLTPPDLFQGDADKLDAEVDQFEREFLTANKLTYRIFRAVIALHSSKWSS